MQCNHIKENGELCQRKARTGERFCAGHAPVEAPAEAQERPPVSNTAIDGASWTAVFDQGEAVFRDRFTQEWAEGKAVQIAVEEIPLAEVVAQELAASDDPKLQVLAGVLHKALDAAKAIQVHQKAEEKIRREVEGLGPLRAAWQGALQHKYNVSTDDEERRQLQEVGERVSYNSPSQRKGRTRRSSSTTAMSGWFCSPVALRLTTAGASGTAPLNNCLRPLNWARGTRHFDSWPGWPK